MISEGKEDLTVEDTDISINIQAVEQPGGTDGAGEISDEISAGGSDAQETERDEADGQARPENLSVKQEDIQTGDDAGTILLSASLLLFSAIILGGVFIIRKKKTKGHKKRPEILAGLILGSMLAISAGIRTEYVPPRRSL